MNKIFKYVLFLLLFSNSYTQCNISSPYGTKFTPLQKSIVNENVARIKSLIKKNVDINACEMPVPQPCNCFEKHLLDAYDVQSCEFEDSDSHISPLHLATEVGNLDIVRELIQAGANVNAQTMLLYTPLQIAVERGYTLIVQELLNAGANVNATGRLGKMPLHNVAKSCHSCEIAKILLKFGANINSADCLGYTPLVYACKSFDLDLTKELLAAGANISTNGAILRNILDKNDMLLHGNMKDKKREMIKFLLNFRNWPEIDIAKAEEYLSRLN